MAAVVDGQRVVAHTSISEVGAASALFAAIDDVLSKSVSLDLVAVMVGLGSVFGVRAGLALAHGISAGGNVPIVGVATSGAPRSNIYLLSSILVAPKNTSLQKSYRRAISRPAPI